jgi:hypothetical protein
MSTKKQEEEIKFLTETFKILITLFIVLTDGLAFLIRSTYPDKNATALKAIDNALLVMGSVFDIMIIVVIFVLGFHIKRIIKEL